MVFSDDASEGCGDGAPAGDARHEPVDPASLLPLLYDELRALAQSWLAHERPGHTLSATAIVHEAYLRMAEQTRARVNDRTHFMALASTMIRRILVDHARTRSRQKRGGDAQRVTLAEVEPIAGDAPASSGMDLLALDEALDRLATKDPLGARVVEMRYFAGLDMDQVASALGIAPRTAKYHWASSRAWLREALTP